MYSAILTFKQIIQKPYTFSKLHETSRLGIPATV